MDSYAWRSCAGQICDAIQFATQMGFTERLNGAWHLDLKSLLRFFGGDREPEIKKSGEEICLSQSLWEGNYNLTIITTPVALEPREWLVDHSLVDMCITLAQRGITISEKPQEYDPLVVRHRFTPKKPYGYNLSANRRGVKFYCPELGGAVCAAQLMYLLKTLGRTMDEYEDIRFLEETM